jgi:hypothetical protein
MIHSLKTIILVLIQVTEPQCFYFVVIFQEL